MAASGNSFRPNWRRNISLIGRLPKTKIGFIQFLNVLFLFFLGASVVGPIYCIILYYIILYYIICIYIITHIYIYK